jgi:hypothetical protein
MLLEFVIERDVECPRCDYYLRNLTKPICPECRETLKLTVGVVNYGFGWFTLTLIPEAFSGICAFILFLPMLLLPILSGGPRPPLPFIVLTFAII